MIIIICTHCLMGLRISGDPVEADYLIGNRSDWYPDKYPCPFGCSNKMSLAEFLLEDTGRIKLHDLNAQEAFQAFYGMGLPKEQLCKANNALDSLLGAHIASAEIRDLPNSNRSVIHSITLEDGTRVYLGASPFGAIVYRIAKPISRVSEFDDNI